MNYPDEQSLRIPPQNIDAEQSVLGSIMLHNKAIEMIGNLQSLDFIRKDHQVIFTALQSLHVDSKPLDWITVSDYIKSTPHLLEQLGVNEMAHYTSYLGTLAKDTPSAANVAAYAEIVREKSQLRQLIGIMTDQIEKAFTGSGSESPAALLDETERKIFALGERSRSGKSKTQHAKPVLSSTLADIQRLAQLDEGEIPGLKSPWPDFDQITSGPEPGDLVVVAARPSMGKTAFAGCWELHAAKAGDPVLCFSLEMSAEQLMKRHISRASSVPFNQVRTGKIDADNWPLIAGMAVKPISKYPLFINDQPGLTVGDIRSEARQMHRQCQKDYGKGLSLITIDYLQLIEMGGGSDKNKSERVGDVTRTLKLLARELKCVIVLLSQLNRSLESRPSKRPIMSDLRESGAIEQDADIILFPYRDVVYNEDTQYPDVCEIGLGKGRNFDISQTPRLQSQLQYQRFASYAPEYQDFE